MRLRAPACIVGCLLGCPAQAPRPVDAACAGAACTDASAGTDAAIALDGAGPVDRAAPDVPPDATAPDRGLSLDVAAPDREEPTDRGQTADARVIDAALDDTGASDAGPQAHRRSLSVCWTDPTCHRALVVAHGGDWNLSDAPFDSREAFVRAYQLGADGIETDVRVSADGVPVLIHSSPIEYYESLACGGQRVEEMTADALTACALVPSSAGQTIQRLDEALAWARGKIILELDVKEARDLARTIAVVVENAATDFAFVMVSSGELAQEVPASPGWEQLHYMLNLGSVSEIQAQAASATTRHVFLFEIERSYPGEADEAAVAALLHDVMIPAGVKGFTSSDKNLATVDNHLQVFAQGFDVVLSYNPSNGVAAAQQENQRRGYVP
jgi:glycerophosphoryl diester phosphodiesterase